MLFFPPPPLTADLAMEPAAVDALVVLNGMAMPKPSELDRNHQQQTEQLQRQLAIMGQQLQQQIPSDRSEPLPPIQSNVQPNLMGPFNGLLSAAQIGEIGTLGGFDKDSRGKVPNISMLTPASCLIPPISGISTIRSESMDSGGAFTQLTPPISRLSQRQQTMDDDQRHFLLQATAGILCSACHRPILDQSFLLVDGQKWHSECCVCVICGQNLEKDEPTCFVRDGFLFCHRDYFAKFGMPCERCGIPIARGELVMKVPNNGNSDDKSMLFHVQCFSCICCGQLLTVGQQFTVGVPGQLGGALFCNAHFHLNPTVAIGQFSYKISEEEQLRFLTEICSANNRKVFEQLPTGGISPNNSQTDSRFSFAESSKENPDSLRLSSPSVTPNGTDAYCAGQNGGGSSNGGETPIGMGGNGRQKRMRTSFKHHQLRTMKNYFVFNHNPDAKDLKQLSQKTGLTKRVLQVWFQNARAKYRRNQQSRGGDVSTMDGVATPSLLTSMSAAHIQQGANGAATGGCAATAADKGGPGEEIRGGNAQNHSLPLSFSATDHPQPLALFFAGSKANSTAQSPNGSVSLGPRSMGGTSSASSFSSAEERSGGSFENEVN